MSTPQPRSTRRVWFGVWIAWMALCAALVEISHFAWPGTIAGGVAASFAGIGSSVIITLWRRRDQTR